MGTEKYNDYISQGIALMSNQNYLSAKVMFEKAIEENPKSTEAYLHLGNACASSNLLDDALDAFKKAQILEPTSGKVLYSLGNVYLLKGQRLKAVEFYNKAEANGFKSVEMYQMMALIFYDAGDTNQALRNISRAIEVKPLDGELRLFKTRIFLAENRFDEALESLDEFGDVLPDAFEVYHLKAQIYMGLQKQKEALQICDEGIKRFPEDLNLSVTKLKVLVSCGMEEEALSLIEEIKSKKDYLNVLKDVTIQESIILLKKNDVEGTIKLLLDANQKLNTDADITYLLMDTYGKTNRFKELLEVSEILIKTPSNTSYYGAAKYFHAHALEQLGREDEAMKEYRNLTKEIRKLTIQEPSFYEGYIYRLLSHTKLKEYDKALELSDYLENMYPDRSDAHAFRYFIYKEKGDTEAADCEKEIAKNMNPNLMM